MRNDIKKDLCLPECRFPTNPGTRYAYFLAQVMPKFTENFGMTFAKKWNIEGLKFARTEMNQHSSKT